MTKHLLLIGIDGLRIDRAFEAGLAPNLAELRETGSYHQTELPAPTISGPGWTTILTGTTHAEHGVTDNTMIGKRFADDSDILSEISQRDYSARTYAIAGWPVLIDPAGPGPIIATRKEDAAAGRHMIVVLDGEMYTYRLTDEETCRRAGVALSYGGPDAAFVYFGETDEAGHYWGVFTEQYDRAVTMTDNRIARLLVDVQKRVDAGEEWIVAITTDHGHVDEGGHGGDTPEEKQTFLLVKDLNGGRIEIPADLQPEQFKDFLIRLRESA